MMPKYVEMRDINISFFFTFSFVLYFILFYFFFFFLFFFFIIYACIYFIPFSFYLLTDNAHKQINLDDAT